MLIKSKELAEKDAGVFLHDPSEPWDLIDPCCYCRWEIINPSWNFLSILWPIVLIFKRSFLLLEVFQDSDSKHEMIACATKADLTAHLRGQCCTDSGCKGCYQPKMTETVQEKAYSSVKYLKEQRSCDARNPSCIDLGVKASSSFIQQQQHPGRSNIELDGMTAPIYSNLISSRGSERWWK